MSLNQNLYVNICILRPINSTIEPLYLADYRSAGLDLVLAIIPLNEQLLFHLLHLGYTNYTVQVYEVEDQSLIYLYQQMLSVLESNL